MASCSLHRNPANFWDTLMTDLVDKAKTALEHPEYFAYYGDLHEADGWGRTGLGQHRDSDELARSNWEVISKDLLERFPDDFATESASHFLVGWVEELRVRVVKEEAAAELDGNFDDLEEEDLTDAFKACIEWAEKLEDYPVADEEHYSRLEYEELIEYLSNEVPGEWDRQRNDDCMGEDDPEYQKAPEDLVEKVQRKLFDNYSVSRVDDIRHNDLIQCINEVAEEPYAKNNL